MFQRQQHVAQRHVSKLSSLFPTNRLFTLAASRNAEHSAIYAAALEPSTPERGQETQAGPGSPPQPAENLIAATTVGQRVCVGGGCWWWWGGAQTKQQGGGTAFQER